MEVKAKRPRLKLVGMDGNAFSILGRAREAARKAKWSDEKINEVMKDAKSGDYMHLLGVMDDHFDTY